MSADLTLFAGETRFVEIAVTSDVDPLSDLVSIAFVAPTADPTADDWHDAEWTPGQAWEAGQAVNARILVGPDDGLTLAKATYDAIVNVLDSPENPWIRAGTIRIK